LDLEASKAGKECYFTPRTFLVKKIPVEKIPVEKRQAHVGEVMPTGD
jgi:hypothetical protein